MIRAEDTIRENSIPKGVTDFLPEQAEKIGFIERTISRIFELWGFRKIIPPMLEFEEILSIGMDEGLRKKAFRFDDRQSHRLLAIPPDITPQVARIEGMRMAGYPLPHRLYYSGRVLRHVESQSGHSREIYQAGVELIGLDSPEADAETIAMSAEALHRMGFSGFKIDLGQAEFFNGIMASAGLDTRSATVIQNAVARKDVSAVRSALEHLAISDRAKEQIVALPRLFGGIDLLDRAAAFAGNDRSKRALDNLSQVIEILEIHGIKDDLTLDLGEIRGLAYHTGVTFEGFVPGLGEPVCSGGRYDSLMGRYGNACPATGFAFNILHLLHALERLSTENADRLPVTMIFNMKRDRREALDLASTLRRQGFPVARDIIRRDIGQSLEYSRHMGIAYVVVLPEVDAGVGQITLIRVSDGSERQLTSADLAEYGSLIFNS